MSSPKMKLLPLSLVCLYPMVSTFVMTLIWQIQQSFSLPFLGVNYFSWVQLYTVETPNWLGAEMLLRTRIYYSVYVVAFVVLAILTVLALVCRRGKAICSFAIAGLWLADCGWIVWDMISAGVTWQNILNLSEHLIFLAWIVLLSLMYLHLKKTNPELFVRKSRKRHKNVYRSRF